MIKDAFLKTLMEKIKALIGYLFIFYAFILFIAILIFSHSSDLLDYPKPIEPQGKTPNFSLFANTREKKAAFFAFFRPIAKEYNESILSKREKIKTIQNQLKNHSALSKKDRSYIETLANRYRVDTSFTIHEITDQLMIKVNAIPESLVLAQAANESAWGTSRFAQQANNFFGQWCFKKGCGIVPKRRAEGASHEVAAFSSPKDSVRAYIDNLNAHPAYTELRLIRAKIAAEDRSITGAELAAGLTNYSERKEEYIAEIRSMIRSNNLE